MNRFTHWMEKLLYGSDPQGIVPKGTSADDYTDDFDPNAEPEQYSEFWDWYYLR
jgi:hypothetical protein